MGGSEPKIRSGPLPKTTPGGVGSQASLGYSWKAVVGFEPGAADGDPENFLQAVLGCGFIHSA